MRGDKVGIRATRWITIAITLALSLCAAAVDDPQPARLSQLRFSPDGRYVLAQDESAITILIVQPFKILFRVLAQQAEQAQFTPDSRQIVFVSSALRVDAEKIAIPKSSARVERWSIATEALVESVALPPLSCSTEKLSPDGGALVCVDFVSNLRLVDVTSGETKIEKKQFAWLYGDYHVNPADSQPWGVLGFAYIEFSPDGSFVVVTPIYADGDAIAVNVRAGSIVKLTGGLKQVKRHWMAWLSPDRLLVSQDRRRTKTDIARGLGNAMIIAFPSGRVLSEAKIPVGLAFFRAASDRALFSGSVKCPPAKCTARQ